MSLTGQTNIREGSVRKETEADLVREAQSNIKAFGKLYDKYYESIFRYVFQRTATKEEAFDITSQVFLKAMTNLNKYEDRGFPFSSWLYRIAKSEVYQYFRNQDKSPVLNVETDQLHQLSQEIEEENTVLNNEQLIEALASLSDDELPYVEMKYLEKRSFREIGEIMGVTENNAKVKTHRIIGRMRKNMLKK